MSERREGSGERLEEEQLGKKDDEVSLEHLRTMVPIRHARAMMRLLLEVRGESREQCPWRRAGISTQGGLSHAGGRNFLLWGRGNGQWKQREHGIGRFQVISGKRMGSLSISR